MVVICNYNNPHKQINVNKFISYKMIQINKSHQVYKNHVLQISYQQMVVVVHPFLIETSQEIY